MTTPAQVAGVAPVMREPRGGGGTLAIVLGIALLLVALVLNPWTLAKFFSPDGHFEQAFFRIAIMGVEALLAAAGLVLIVRRPRITAGDLVATSIAWMLVFVGLEVVMRSLYAKDDLWYATMRRSPVFGWEVRPDLDVTRDLGPEGSVRYTTGADGFRRRADGVPAATTILALGDSYTEAVQVDDGGAYYDWLADSAGLDLAVYAYGASAYGSLQEYLVMDRFIDEIGADLVLWQFCANDLINNLRAAEARSLFNNSWWRRPYLEDGEIRMRTPSMNPLTQHSRLAQFVASRRAIVRSSRAASGSSGERTIEDDLHPEHPIYREALRATTEIMGMVARRAGHRPVVAFTVNEPLGSPDAFERAAEANGIRFVRGIPEALDAARRAGIKVDRDADGHWSAVGHGIAARIIADSLVAWGLVHADRDTADPTDAARR